MPTIKLQSSDGEIFEVDVEVAKASITIKTMLEDLGIGDEQEVIPLVNVRGRILELVIQWATHHKDDPPVLDTDERRTDDISPWDVEFLKLDDTTMMDLIVVANFLDIKGLLELTCKTVADMIKGKTPEQIRQTFGIVNDLTPEEEEQIRQGQDWKDEK